MGLFKEFASETHIHGLREVVNAENSSLRYAWLITVVTAGFMLTAQVYTLAVGYQHEHTGTSVEPWGLDSIPKLHVCPTFYISNERMKRNLGLPDDAEMLEAIKLAMDGFLTHGSMERSFHGASMDPEELAKIGSNDDVDGLKFLINHYIIPKYGNSIEKFIEENSYKIDEIVSRVRVSPISVNSTMSTDYSWEGLCVTFDFSQKFDQFQFTNLQVDITLNILPDANFANLFPPELTPSPENRMQIGVGNPSYNLVSVRKRSKAKQGNEYLVEVHGTRFERVNLRRKPCKDYSFEESMYHRLTTAAEHLCRTCKTLLKDGFDLDKHCNYAFLDESRCLREILLSSEAVPNSQQPPLPCVEEEYRVNVGVPSPATNATILHISFPGRSTNVLMKEYPVVTIPVLMSSLGGTMGLYFGMSLLSIFQLVLFMMCRAIKRKVAVAEEKPTDETGNYDVQVYQ